MILSVKALWTSNLSPATSYIFIALARSSFTQPAMASATPTADQSSQTSQPSLPSSPPNKRDLKSWWKGFKLAKHQEPQGMHPPQPPHPDLLLLAYCDIALTACGNGYGHLCSSWFSTSPRIGDRRPRLLKYRWRKGTSQSSMRTLVANSLHYPVRATI